MLAENFQKVRNLVDKLDFYYMISTTLTLSDDDTYCSGGWSRKTGYKMWMSEIRLSTFYKQDFTEYHQVKYVWEKFGYYRWYYAFSHKNNKFYGCSGMNYDTHIWALTLHEYAHVLDRGMHGHSIEYCDILYNLIKQFPYSESILESQKPWWA